MRGGTGDRSAVRKRDTLTRLDAELVQVEPVLLRWQAHHEQVRDASLILLENVAPLGAPQLSEDSIAKLISPIRFEWTIDPPLATLASLESSRRLASIRIQELLTQLASWRPTLLDLQKDEENLRQRLASHFVPFLQARIAYRSLGPGSATQWKGSAFPSDIGSLLGSREFEGTIDEQLDRASTNVANSTRHVRGWHACVP